MVVIKMLIKRDLERTLEDALSIHQEMKNRAFPETDELALQVEKKIKQLKSFELALSFMELSAYGSELNDLNAAFRQLKIEVRLIRRKWKRTLSMESRMRKFHEKESHVASFVA